MEPETKVCVKCEASKPLEKFHLRNRKYRDNMCSACFGRRERALLKLAVLDAFGSKCNCCAETHPDFLTLDHIVGSENEHKNNQRTRTGRYLRSHQIWRQVLKEGCPPDKYQLLCIGCNWAKGLFGVCPHQTRTPIQALERLRKDAEGIGHSHVKYNSSTWFGHD